MPRKYTQDQIGDACLPTNNQEIELSSWQEVGETPVDSLDLDTPETSQLPDDDEVPELSSTSHNHPDTPLLPAAVTGSDMVLDFGVAGFRSFSQATPEPVIDKATAMKHWTRPEASAQGSISTSELFQLEGISIRSRPIPPPSPMLVPARVKLEKSDQPSPPAPLYRHQQSNWSRGRPRQPRAATLDANHGSQETSGLPAGDEAGGRPSRVATFPSPGRNADGLAAEGMDDQSDIITGYESKFASTIPQETATDVQQSVEIARQQSTTSNVASHGMLSQPLPTAFAWPAHLPTASQGHCVSRPASYSYFSDISQATPPSSSWDPSYLSFFPVDIPGPSINPQTNNLASPLSPLVPTAIAQGRLLPFSNPYTDILDGRPFLPRSVSHPRPATISPLMSGSDFVIPTFSQSFAPDNAGVFSSSPPVTSYFAPQHEDRRHRSCDPSSTPRHLHVSPSQHGLPAAFSSPRPFTRARARTTSRSPGPGAMKARHESLERSLSCSPTPGSVRKRKSWSRKNTDTQLGEVGGREQGDRSASGRVIGFVNYTPDDGSMLMTGVAPSGSSRTKARLEKEMAERQRLLHEAAVKAVQAVGGDIGILKDEGLVT